MPEKNPNINEKLMKIQVELKAPKNLYNSFGKYNYRNVESIQEALKPLMKKYNCAVSLSDEVIEISGRFYIKAYARITDCDTGEYKETTAYARESDEKKGMDSAQVTGSTSSYARKYALNGLFLLDDTKDIDTEEFQAQAKGQTKKAEPKKVEAKAEAPKTLEMNSRQKLKVFCQNYGVDPKEIISACNLRPDSTEEEWANALEYAVRTFKVD